MKKLILTLAVLLCVSFMASCGKQTEAPPAVKSEAPVTEKVVYKATDGVVKIKPNPKSEQASVAKSTVTPDTVWNLGAEEKSNVDDSFTVPTKEIIKENGSLGTLSIPTIKLQMSVFETEDTMEAMRKGAAHFKSTSMWAGNVGVSAHNDGVPDAVSFGKLNKLKKGDSIIYTTEFGVRSYEVSEIATISDTDWGYLSRTEDNRITLITCVSGQPDKRLMVQAVEKAE